MTDDVPHGGDSAPISRIVSEVAAAFPGERISLGEMAHAFGDRAFGLLLLALALPPLALGTWLGWRLYGRLDDKAFRRMMGAVLAASGATLLF